MSGLEIPVVQRLIDSLLLKQFLMGSFFGNPILCKYQYLLGILDRRQPVGDHEGSPVLCQPFQGSLHYLLALIIQSRSRFIEDQYGRVLKKYSCDRQPLFLSAGQFYPCL